MKVLILNGSPRVDGNTSTAVDEIVKTLQEEGVESEVVQIGNKAIRGCVACGGCSNTGKCVFDDEVNEIAPKFEEADGLIVASPVYYANANATLIDEVDAQQHLMSLINTLLLVTCQLLQASIGTAYMVELRVIQVKI